MATRGARRLEGRPARRWWILITVFASIWLFAPLASFGVWDPHEVETADLARRVAVHALGADHLARPSDPPGSPTLSDLGSGELGVTSIAASFALFGVSDVSGRLPLALWGAAGALALHLALARTVGRRAARLAVLALLAMPVFFLQARTMLGDVVVMSATATVLAGGLLVTVERSRRWVALGAALLALGVAAAFMSRGVPAVAPPLLAFGAVAASRAERTTRVRAAALAGVGLVAALLTVWLFTEHAGSPLTARAVGATLVDAEPRSGTFDRVFRHLGHGMFPLSALLPMAVTGLSRRLGRGEDAASVGRIVLLAGALASLGAALLTAPLTGALPFFGVVFVAALLGEHAARARVEPPSRAAVVVTLLLLAVLRFDVHREPDRLLEAFGMGVVAREGARGPATPGLMIDLAAAALALLLVLASRPLDAPLATGDAPARRSAREYLADKRRDLRASVAALALVRDGRVVFAFVLIEAALVGMAVMLAVGGRLGWQALASLPDAFARVGVAAWWAVPLAAFSLYVSWTLARDVTAALRARLRLGGSALVGAAFVSAGAALAFVHFPRMFDRASPRHALRTYERLRGADDALGVHGASPALAPFYVDGPVSTFGDLPRAFMFLDKSELTDARHFLALRRDDLPMLNQLWRLEHRANVPVVDASSDMILVASRGVDGAPPGPLDGLVRDAPPALAHEASAIFDEAVELVGWQISSASGKQADVLVTGEPYTLTVALEVKRRPDEEWQAFVHIERQKTRYNGDHTPVGGVYPMRLWLPKDVLVDEHVFTLPPNFTPGSYRVLFGFFVAGDRVVVTEGEAKDGRVTLGAIEVR